MSFRNKASINAHFPDYVSPLLLNALEAEQKAKKTTDDQNKGTIASVELANVLHAYAKPNLNSVRSLIEEMDQEVVSSEESLNK